MTPDLEILKDLIVDLEERREWEEIRTMLMGQHAADIAEIIRESPEELRNQLFALLEEDTKPDVLAELEPHQSAELLEPLSNEEISELVEEMEPDDAADILSDLSEDRSEKILAGMEEEDSHDVRELLRYDEESAGGIMTTILVRFAESITVAQAIEQMAYVDIDEPVYNIYITDQEGVLTGVLGLWELLKQRNREATLGHVAHHNPVAVHTDLDQEEIARLMAKYDLNAVPVVDDAGHLVGRITVDDVMDVIEEEASEDIMRMAGTSDRELADSTPLQATRTRLPWLLITLATGFVTSFLFREFMDNLAEVLVLSFFVPIVMAMGGNTGIQSSTLIIRRLALDTLDTDGLMHILGREFVGALMMGVICGTVIALWATYLVSTSGDQHSYAFPPYFLGGVVGLSLLSAMVFAAVFGAFTPIMLNKVNIDPAVASGPFVTSSNDIFALLIYYGTTFGLISVAVRWFPGGG